MPDWLDRANAAAREAGAASHEKHEASRQRGRESIAKWKAGRAAEAEERRVAAGNLPQVEVVTYKTPKDYQRDAQRRIAEGWTVQAQSQETGQTHRIRRASSGAVIGSLFMLPLAGAAIGGLSGKRSPGAITVTWVKGPVSSAKGLGVERMAQDRGPKTTSVASQLASLAELHDAGVLTDEEFQTKKAELLSRM